ncbi:zinc-dependent alcohol dehydrogenase [Paeniglutamicibacter sp.]|uniref:zinc-dependent alcohol dehydrogenase n=1 Tax=Paeniglutamicibacter sp. TaxID=1934391 RepID=UPI003989DFB3
MFALQKVSSAPWDLRISDVQTPQLADGEVLLQPQAVGICGSDVHAARSDEGYEWLRPPLILGHEVTGLIAAAAPGLESLIGRRAVVIAIDGCGECSICRQGDTNYCEARDCIGIHADGGLAEYLAIPAIRLFLLPRDSELDPVLAALIEPAAIALQAISRLEMELAGAPIGVSGPGAIGLFSGLALLDAGASVHMYGPAEGAESRVAFAKRLGMHVGQQDDSFAAVGWVEASGSAAALNAALQRLGLHSKIVVPAMFPNLTGVNMNLIVRKGLSFHGTYGYVRSDYEAAHRLIQKYQGQLKEMITIFPFEDSIDAIERTSRAELIKAVILKDVKHSQ